MAHLGQKDRKDPLNPVFVRYITKNTDWEKLTIKTENGQFADMYEKDDDDNLKEMGIKINPRTEIKLLSNKFVEIETRKYVQIEYLRKKGYVLISKLRKPTDQSGKDRPPKLEILAETFTEGGSLTEITVLTQNHVEVMSFQSFDELKTSIIVGAEKKLRSKNPYVIEKIKTYLEQDQLKTIDLNGIDDTHIDELGIYFGEVLPGLLAFKRQLNTVCIPSHMLGTELKMFAIPTDPAFKLVDSVLMFNDTTVSVSSKYGAGAAASFMTNVLPYGLKYHRDYAECFFKKMCKTASKLGFTSEQVGADKFRKSKNIMMEVGIRDILGIKTSVVKNVNHSVYNSIHKIATGKDITPKENQELDEVIETIEEHFEKRKGFGGGATVITTIRDNYPVSIPTFFNYTVAHSLENDPISKKYVENIIGGKSFYQANLDKSAWTKGEILIKMVYPKSAKLKILGSMSSAVDYTTKHGMVNYELK